MTSAQVIAAVAAWAQASAPQLDGRAYAHVPAGKPKGLPDVVVELQFESVVRDDPDFALTDLQQVPALRVWTLELSIMAGVKPADPKDEASIEDAHATTTDALRVISTALSEALIADERLGARVPLASPYHAFDFTDPFIEWGDGTRGREVRMSMKVCEPLVVVD